MKIKEIKESIPPRIDAAQKLQKKYYDDRHRFIVLMMAGPYDFRVGEQVEKIKLKIIN